MTTKQLIEELQELIAKHPTFADVQVVREDHLSIDCVEVESEDGEVVIRIE